MSSIAIDLRRMVRAATGDMRPLPTNFNYIQRLLRKVDPEISGHFDLGILAAHKPAGTEVQRHADNVKRIIAKKYGTEQWRDLLRHAAYAPTRGAQERQLA